MITNKFGEKYYKIGLHIHTTISDGAKSPEAVAEEYRADGFDAIAFTDHWKHGEGGEVSGLHIIPGCEYNLGSHDTISGVIHILSLFTKKDPCLDRNDTAETVVNAITENGGIAVLAHPAWSVNSPTLYANVKGFVATEIYNAVSDAEQSLRPYSDHFIDLCANSGLYPHILATDDAHYYKGADSRKGWIMVKADELSDDSLARAIKDGEFYATQGPELHVTLEGRRLVIDTSPCSVIGTISNASWCRGRTLRGENLTHFEYEATETEKWIRVEARDKDGQRAWSNIFVLN